MDKIKQLLFLKKPEDKEPKIESNLDLPDDGPADSPEPVYKFEKSCSLSESANIPNNMKILRSSSEDKLQNELNSPLDQKSWEGNRQSDDPVNAIEN